MIDLILLALQKIDEVRLLRSIKPLGGRLGNSRLLLIYLACQV